MNGFLKEIEKRILVHDGSKGFMLQQMGLKGGECGEEWNIINQDAVREIYRSYLEAGSDVIQTNTFSGSRMHLQKYGLGDKTYEINYHGVKLAKEITGEKAFVCASAGPTGYLFEPSGELTFDMARELFREQVRAFADGGADIINFESFTDLAELRAAYFSAREVCDLPVICSMTFENNGRTLMGTDPFIAVLVLKSLGADMVGANCSFGPEHMAGIVKSFYEAGGGYLSIKPNAGLPRVDGDRVVYEETPEHFADQVSNFIRYGARLIGGCCGTTPPYISALKSKIEGMEPGSVMKRPSGYITSTAKYIHISEIDQDNTGLLDASSDEGFLEAVVRNDWSYIEETALDMAAEGFDAIRINVDRAGKDATLLRHVVDRVQWYVREPLILETDNAASLENALAVYRGVAGVVINGEEPSKAALKETAKKYGSVIMAS
ncbi:MAG: homocysteine S-methyltransferase family protein [Acetivibrionales bacterium]|jgi:5-methyltetrahydrofolate--homocysteine methyltransferase